MGYTTDFKGCLTPTPALTDPQAAYINALASTRRMKRDVSKLRSVPDPVRSAVNLPLGDQGAYFVGEPGDFGQGDHFGSVVDYNSPPGGQPGLWCQWIIDDDGTLAWNQGEKFYHYVEWLRYLIDHFFKPWGVKLNGRIQWQGEESDDKGTIEVSDNVVVGHRGVHLTMTSGRDSDPTTTFNAYAAMVAQYHVTRGDADIDTVYSVLGLTGKAGEIASLLKKSMRDETPAADLRAALCEELGNLLFYLNSTAIAVGMTLDEVADKNIKRLVKKHSNG